MDTRLMVDVATAVMGDFDLMSDMDEDVTEHFCQQLEKAFKEAAAGAPDLRSAIDERAAFEKAMNDARFFPRELDFGRTTSPGGRDEYENSHLESNWNGWQARAALASAAPVEAAPLTPEEIDEIARKYNLDGSMLHGSRFKDYLRPFARAIEARIKGGAK